MTRIHQRLSVSSVLIYFVRNFYGSFTLKIAPTFPYLVQGRSRVLTVLFQIVSDRRLLPVRSAPSRRWQICLHAPGEDSQRQQTRTSLPSLFREGSGMRPEQTKILRRIHDRATPETSAPTVLRRPPFGSGSRSASERQRSSGTREGLSGAPQREIEASRSDALFRIVASPRWPPQRPPRPPCLSRRTGRLQRARFRSSPARRAHLKAPRSRAFPTWPLS